MKKLIVMFGFVLIMNNTRGQESFIKNVTDTTLLVASVIETIGVCPLITSFCVCDITNTVSKGSTVFVTKLVECNNGYSSSKYKFFEFVYNGHVLYCDIDKLYLKNITLKKLSSIDSIQSNNLLNHALFVSQSTTKKESDKANVKLQYCKSQGIAIKDYTVYEISEHTEGTGFNIEFWNPTNKTIKYVSIKFVGKNTVGDNVKDRIGNIYITKKVVGPILPMEFATFDFPYCWFTDLVYSVKIISLEIVYQDESKKIVKWNDSLLIDNQMFDLIQFR